MKKLEIYLTKKDIRFKNTFINILTDRIFAYEDYYSYILECKRINDKQCIILFQTLKFKDEFI